MSGITLANPIAAFSEKIAQPFDDAAPIVRQIAGLYHDANQQLQTDHDTLVQTFKGMGADSFTNMISKQTNWVNGIVDNLNTLAGFYETCANDVRTAARVIEGAIQPFLDLVQWVIDRLTPDIVVQQGESAIQAVFDDMKAQLKREMNDAGGFFSSVVHLHFSTALHDVEDGVKGLAHLGEDAIGLVASLEPILCQWGADIYQAVNWLRNKIGGWGLDAANWLLGLSSIADDTTVFTDPNSTSEEKWMAGIDMGLNVVMDVALFIPGADIFALGGKGAMKLLEKFGLKEVLDTVTQKAMEKVTENVVAQVVKGTIDKFVQKISQKFSEAIVERTLNRDLTRTAFSNLEGKIRQKVFPEVQAIIDDYLAGKISKEEAQARLEQLIQNASPLHSGGRAGIDEFNWQEKFPGLSDKQLAQRVEKLRQGLLNAKDISKVQQSLAEMGVKIDSDTLQAIKQYNFNSRGLAFTVENYEAWKRLVSGNATVSDVRYIIHEQSELNFLKQIQQKTGFDFMGRSWEQMTNSQRQQWLADFDRYYGQAHSQALFDEYKFISQSVSNITNGSVRISPVVAAAIDPNPVEKELRNLMEVDGLPLAENPQFSTWASQGNTIVTLNSAAARRLGLYTNRITEADLIRAIKAMRLSKL